MINKYAEINDRILLYNACKGILRVKQAATGIAPMPGPTQYVPVSTKKDTTKPANSNTSLLLNRRLGGGSFFDSPLFRSRAMGALLDSKGRQVLLDGTIVDRKGDIVYSPSSKTKPVDPEYRDVLNKKIDYYRNKVNNSTPESSANYGRDVRKWNNALHQRFRLDTGI